MAAEHGKQRRFPFGGVTISVLCCLVSLLGGNGPAHEGRRYVPYRDSGGVWTVCAGVTGEAVMPGRHYTQTECERMEAAYVNQMLRAMSDCIDGAFWPNEVIAWGHFAYNIGTDEFCQSRAARRLNAGERKSACAEMSKWVFVAGKDCRNPRSNCNGIVQRRAWVQAMCEGYLN